MDYLKVKPLETIEDVEKFLLARFGKEANDLFKHILKKCRNERKKTGNDKVFMMYEKFSNHRYFKHIFTELSVLMVFEVEAGHLSINLIDA